MARPSVSESAGTINCNLDFGGPAATTIGGGRLRGGFSVFPSFPFSLLLSLVQGFVGERGALDEKAWAGGYSRN